MYLSEIQAVKLDLEGLRIPADVLIHEDYWDSYQDIFRIVNSSLEELQKVAKLPGVAQFAAPFLAWGLCVSSEVAQFFLKIGVAFLEAFDLVVVSGYKVISSPGGLGAFDWTFTDKHEIEFIE